MYLVRGYVNDNYSHNGSTLNGSVLNKDFAAPPPRKVYNISILESYYFKVSKGCVHSMTGTTGHLQQFPETWVRALIEVVQLGRQLEVLVPFRVMTSVQR